MLLEWAEFTDGVDAHVRPLLRAPTVGERTWWLSSDGCTVGCVVASVQPVLDRTDGVRLRVFVAGSWSDE